MAYIKENSDLSCAMKSITKAVYNMPGHTISENLFSIIAKDPTLVTTTSLKDLKFLHHLLLNSPRKNAAENTLRRQLKDALYMDQIPNVAVSWTPNDWLKEGFKLMNKRDPELKITDLHKRGLGYALIAIHLERTDMKELSTFLIRIAQQFVKQHYPEKALLILSVLWSTFYTVDDNCPRTTAHVLKKIADKLKGNWWILANMAMKADQTFDDSVKMDAMCELDEAWKGQDLTKILNIALTRKCNICDLETFVNSKAAAVKCDFKMCINALGPVECALYFFQGFIFICTHETELGLFYIEKAFWSGHYTNWLSETAVPTVISLLGKYNFVARCGHDIENILHFFHITDDLTPFIKPLWPHLIHRHLKWENDIEQIILRETNRDAGYALMEYSTINPAEKMVCFLNASLWFLRELKDNEGSTKEMSDKILDCLHQARQIAINRMHSGMQFYMARLGLAVAVETIHVVERYTKFNIEAIITKWNIEAIIDELKEVVINIGRFWPFWRMPIVTVSEAILLNILTEKIHSLIMHNLQNVDSTSEGMTAQSRDQLAIESGVHEFEGLELLIKKRIGISTKTVDSHSTTLILMEEAIKEVQETFTTNFHDMLVEMDPTNCSLTSPRKNSFEVGCVKVLLTLFGGFQDLYEEKCRNRVKKLIPATSYLRDQALIDEFRKSKEAAIERKDAAHILSLEVVRHLLIYVDGRDITAHDVEQIKRFLNQPFNLEITEQAENRSAHRKKDGAFNTLIDDYLEYGCIKEETWRNLDKERITTALSICIQNTCPTAIFTRIGILKKITDPESGKNLWTLCTGQ